MKHFLVERDRTGLRKITVYEDGGEAYEAFTQRERELYPWRSGYSTTKHPEVVLLEANSLSTCIATHSSWFDESADPMDLFQPTLKRMMSTEETAAIQAEGDRLSAMPGTSTGPDSTGGSDARD